MKRPYIEALEKLEEPTRSKAFDTFKRLCAEGIDPEQAAQTARAEAEEWKGSRVPSQSPPGNRSSTHETEGLEEHPRKNVL